MAWFEVFTIQFNHVVAAFSTSVCSKGVVQSYIFQSRVIKLYFQSLWKSIERQKQRELSVSTTLQVRVADNPVKEEN